MSSRLLFPDPGQDPVEDDILQPGTEQVAAGYILYGSSTMLVYIIGMATDGLGNRIMELTPGAIHQRTPFFTGSRVMVEEVEKLISKHG